MVNNVGIDIVPISAPEISTAAGMYIGIDITPVSAPQPATTVGGMTYYAEQPESWASNQGGFTTAHISGVVKKNDGTPFLGGATVILIREGDGQVVGTTTSSTADGSYSFACGRGDTHRYLAIAWDATGDVAITARDLRPS